MTVYFGGEEIKECVGRILQELDGPMDAGRHGDRTATHERVGSENSPTAMM